MSSTSTRHAFSLKNQDISKTTKKRDISKASTTTELQSLKSEKRDVSKTSTSNEAQVLP